MISLDQFKTMIPLVFESVAVLASLRAFLHNFPQPLKTLSKLWVAMLFIDIVARVIRDIEPNYWLYNLFRIPFYLYLVWVYFQVLSNATIRTTIRIFYFSFIVFALFNTLFFQGLFTYQTMTIVFGGCFISFLAGAYFWQMFNSSGSEPIVRDPFFWLSLGLVVYFGGTVPFLGMFNYLSSNHPVFHVFYFEYVYYSFSAFLNINVAIAFLCRATYPRLY